MSYNPSLAKFKNEMRSIRERVRVDARKAARNQAEEIAQNMREVAAKDEGGLAESVRVIDVSKTFGNRVQITMMIRGGGRLTLRRNQKSGELYDYAVANEFGTREMRAQPFFYSTFRRYQSLWPETMAETVQESIAKNNEMLAQHEAGPSSGTQSGYGIIYRAKK